MDEKTLYDRYYYLTGCGVKYDDRPKWEAFFGEIADRIVQDINPKTVLDAGCAYGYLVAALRDRGVEAFGIDISDYAISQVREDIRPFCSVGSVLEPLSQRYDLIICIEVLEHLEPGDSRKSIENLCQYTDDFMFTSTPTDFKEATHFNVQPTEYWIRLFANCGFYRDVDFDATFIILHAIRFRKIKDTFSSILVNYEKTYFRYFSENKVLRDELIATRAALSARFDENESSLLAEKNQIIKDKDYHIHNLDKFLSERDEYIKSINQIAAEREKEIINLNESVQEKRRIAEMAEKIDQLTKLIQQKDFHELSFQEVSSINDDLKGKLAHLFNQKADRENIIKGLQTESESLKAEIRNLKAYEETALLPYKSAAAELERIKNLKGHKLLWKYYEFRDRVFLRHRPSEAPGLNMPTHPPNFQSATSSGGNSDTILEREKRYYSQNPIFNIDFNYTPLISIVVPVFNTPEDVLEEMIKSVVNQTYPEWEFILIDAGEDSTAQASLIQKYIREDKRIVYKKIENKGIAANTNIGIDLSKGEFIAFLDHDDIISPIALFEIVSRLQEDRSAHDFFYSDKDMLQSDGRTLCNPLYKPQWSPEIMFSANYLTHFCVIRRDLILECGLLDSKTDGAQDWDIFLKVSRLTDKICHVPYKSYHWRIIPTSVASGIGAKPYALQAQLTSLQNHFTALDYKARIKFNDKEKSILKVEWLDTGVKQVSFVINHTGTSKQLYSLLGQINQYSTIYEQQVEAIILTQGGGFSDNGNAGIKLRVVESIKENKYADINNILNDTTGDILVLMDSQVSFSNAESIHDLVSWAAQKQYGAISPQLKDAHNNILSTGIVINEDCILNMFQHVGSEHYTIMGHTEWYRNITAVHAECFAIKASLLKDGGGFRSDNADFSCIDLCLRLSKTGLRHVYSPFSKVIATKLPDLNASKDLSKLMLLKKEYGLAGCDPYWNPNLMSNRSIPAENKRKVNILPTAKEAKHVITGWEKYSNDAFYLAHEFDFSTSEFNKNLEIVQSNKGHLDIKTVNWILPHFDFIYYAGLYTIFRTANYLQSEAGVQNTIITVGGNNEREIHDVITEAFPLMKDCKVVCLSGPVDIKKIPYADASVCSLWTTAYYLLRFQNTKRKFYFIQDFEPLFYPAGSTYGQTENTYNFGFYGLTNTQGLRKIYEEQYNGKAIDLKPCIDGNIFHARRPTVRQKVWRVFFYGRPGHPRNGFELGSTALKVLKNRLKDKVEIYCAGSDWDPADYGLSGVLTNMGRMDFEKTGDLYRICDVGLVMMFTKHPSYLPFELMACGCAVVSNHNKDTTWFLKDGENCLLTDASSTRIAETIEKLLLDNELRERISRNAEKNIRENHGEWDVELSALYEFMCQPEAGTQVSLSE